LLLEGFAERDRTRGFGQPELAIVRLVQCERRVELLRRERIAARIESPPPNGPWMIGYRTPRRRAAALLLAWGMSSFPLSIERRA